MKDKWFGRFGQLVLLPNCIFVLLMLFFSPTLLITTFNSLIAALAVGVCVAYFPVIQQILTSTQKPIDKADLLALGIFVSWFGMVLRTCWSLIWRYYGQPDDWANTHFTSYFIFFGICGAVFHLAAPGTVGGRIPTRHWVRLGVIAATGVFTGLLGAYWFGII